MTENRARAREPRRPVPNRRCHVVDGSVSIEGYYDEHCRCLGSDEIASERRLMHTSSPASTIPGSMPRANRDCARIGIGRGIVTQR